MFGERPVYGYVPLIDQTHCTINKTAFNIATSVENIWLAGVDEGFNLIQASSKFYVFVYGCVPMEML